MDQNLSFIPSGYGNATRVATRFAGIPIPYVNGTYGNFFNQNLTKPDASYLSIPLKKNEFFLKQFFSFLKKWKNRFNLTYVSKPKIRD